MAQPVGVGVGAISIAVIADRHGISTALWVPTLAALGALVITAAVVLDPPRPARTETTHVANPYRTDAFLARIHGVSVLLVVPQFLVWTFALVWLTDDRDWSSAAPGALVGASPVVGALGGVAAGPLSRSEERRVGTVGVSTFRYRWV